MFFYIWMGGIVLAAFIFSISITLRYDSDNLFDALDDFAKEADRREIDGATIGWAMFLLIVWPLSSCLFGAFLVLFLFPYKLTIFTIRSFRRKS